jgi:hypothetical protein
MGILKGKHFILLDFTEKVWKSILIRKKRIMIKQKKDIKAGQSSEKWKDIFYRTNQESYYSTNIATFCWL